MKQAGQIVLFRFPHTDLEEGKLRPALLLGQLPGEYDDWLICMISSQIRHYLPDFDEIVREDDSDFTSSGLNWTLSISTCVADSIQQPIEEGAGNYERWRFHG